MADVIKSESDAEPNVADQYLEDFAAAVGEEA